MRNNILLIGSLLAVAAGGLRRKGVSMRIRETILVLTISFISIVACSSERVEPQRRAAKPQQRGAPQKVERAIPAPANDPIPAGVKYEIINEDKLHNVKRSMDIRLNRKVSEEILRRIAQRLKASDSTSYERTFIAYYLEGMIVDNGAWATTHFNPDLKVVIQGLTFEQEAKILGPSAEKPEKNKKIISRWLDETMFAGNKATMYSKKGKLFLERLYSDGSSGVTRLRTKKVKGKKRFIEVGNEHGEYYLINGAGDLQSFDRDGLISTAKKIKQK